MNDSTDFALYTLEESAFQRTGALVANAYPKFDQCQLYVHSLTTYGSSLCPGVGHQGPGVHADHPAQDPQDPGRPPGRPLQQ